MQVVLLSSPIPGQPLINSSNPSVDDDFVKEMTAILSGADAAHRQSRVERALPYELRAVEVGLATAVRAWEMEAIVLEQRTRPTLRALLHKVRLPEGCALVSVSWSHTDPVLVSGMCVAPTRSDRRSLCIRGTARVKQYAGRQGSEQALSNATAADEGMAVAADVTDRAGQAAELQGRQSQAPQPPQHCQAGGRSFSTMSHALSAGSRGFPCDTHRHLA